MAIKTTIVIGRYLGEYYQKTGVHVSGLYFEPVLCGNLNFQRTTGSSFHKIPNTRTRLISSKVNTIPKLVRLK